MKILMLIPVWKRPEILRLFLWRMQAVIPDYAELMPLFILSPEDPHLQVIEKFIDDYACVYYPNEYLGDKLNAGMLAAMDYQWDYLMGMGSDNIYTPLMWNLYEDYFETGERYFGLNSFYVYDIINNRAALFDKYVDEPKLGGIGAGRVIHRSLIEDDPMIYRTKTNQGMDGFSAWTLAQRGYIMNIIETGELPVMLDVKTNTNINHSAMIWPDKTKEVPVPFVKQEFGIYDAEILDCGAFDLINFDNFHGQVCKLSQQIGQGEAFRTVNLKYKLFFGEYRYKNVETYQSIVSRKYKRDV